MKSCRFGGRCVALVGLFAKPHMAFVANRLAVVGASNPAVSFSSTLYAPKAFRMSSSRASSTSGAAAPIKHIGKAEMQEILEDYEDGGTEESRYIVIDVRGDDEVMYTGKLAPSVITLPIQVIMSSNAFQMDPDDFEEAFGFVKPDLDDTLVFTCAAGVRSVYACQAAARAGYSKLVNYVGGANDWFT
ncbi:predicted protein [Phaeodactylum tricornutum CCAP 1055/1]|jgi:rhodanese-related sulfurtransferase|uniref:Rhodanese domain-containing protein n=2 Tax=Phaeodactylum tricornutum TaxID=2850 RepID=B7FUW9_PHATC|nr:predicted protein [Phaeodactylum tricornutum CCAP 1055/1]EEC50058.1 predicted protein [Phaeodactylum tricornutum CCAP 1055/1]|eukprot:XP_002178393.1 predicted protein [Phaeodactylum tricornutum CCAP 1055/1]